MTDGVLYFNETTFKNENEWTYKLSEAELLDSLRAHQQDYVPTPNFRAGTC